MEPKGERWKMKSVVMVLVLMVVGSCTAAPADGRSVFADNSLCPEPRCVTFEEINTLWAITDPAYFLQCRPDVFGSWSPQLMPCAPETLFSFRQQVCVQPQNWEGCGGSTESTPTLPTTTQVTGEPDTTTQGTGEQDTTTQGTGEQDTTTQGTDDPLSTTTPGAGTTEVTPIPTDVTPYPSPGDICPGPLCVTFEQINTLWVYNDSPDFFWQCRPIDGIWAPILMPCAPATKFSFQAQVCVLQELYVGPECVDANI
ncbi:uncharacterized protein LOC126556594 [Anopheles maculipalpis]|uniref:uncharacterized protein LOC126556594 n=1 Tax=Anopheles maculipalpis TaxID=1496333 RepID=UPI0021594182|nr:uncharacterized protein LOC126556594 [Anopheles maculipalpis]